jgi:hypothetical protein
MLSKVKIAVSAALVLATASAAVAQGVTSHRPLAASDRGYDGYGCTNYGQYLYDSHDCDPQR